MFGTSVGTKLLFAISLQPSRGVNSYAGFEFKKAISLERESRRGE